jgi:hypothetical protein
MPEPKEGCGQYGISRVMMMSWEKNDELQTENNGTQFWYAYLDSTRFDQSHVPARLFEGKVAGASNCRSATTSARRASECGEQSDKRIAYSL